MRCETIEQLTAVEPAPDFILALRIDIGTAYWHGRTLLAAMTSQRPVPAKNTVRFTAVT
jgi:hypothetical protein